MASEYWDIHNHLLPGIDDGSCCMDETFDLLKEEHDQGVRNIVFTPHCRPGMFDVKASDRERVYEEVCKKAGPMFPDMTFYLGCEFFVHTNKISSLGDVRCRMAGTRAVLLEFSAGDDSDYVEDSVEEVSASGMFPVLAHVERYRCMYESDDLIRRLKGRGALIQVNAGSVLGVAGRPQKKLCRRLIKEGLVDFIASDAHNMDSRPVRMGKVIETVTKEYGKEVSERIFKTNPERMFGRF